MGAAHFAHESQMAAYRRATHKGTPCMYPTFICKVCNTPKSLAGSKGSGLTKRCASCDTEQKAKQQTLEEQEEGLPEHKKTGYSERVAEAADMIRDRMREERLLNGSKDENQGFS